MPRAKKPPETRQQRFNAKMVENGHKQIRIWCPEDRVEELQVLVAKWRDKHEKANK